MVYLLRGSWAPDTALLIFQLLLKDTLVDLFEYLIADCLNREQFSEEDLCICPSENCTGYDIVVGGQSFAAVIDWARTNHYRALNIIGWFLFFPMHSICAIDSWETYQTIETRTGTTCRTRFLSSRRHPCGVFPGSMTLCWKEQNQEGRGWSTPQGPVQSFYETDCSQSTYVQQALNVSSPPFPVTITMICKVFSLELSKQVLYDPIMDKKKCTTISLDMGYDACRLFWNIICLNRLQ